MSSQGPLYAGQGQSILDSLPGTPAPWSNPNNVTSPGDYADAFVDSFGTDTSEYLVGNGFGFGVPADATLDGIKAEFEAFNDGLVQATDNSVRLYLDSSIVGSELAAGTQVPLSTGWMVYGGATEKWGVTWDAAAVALLNGGAFGTGFSVQAPAVSSATVRVYRIRMTVYYTLPPVQIPAKLIVRQSDQFLTEDF